MAGEFLVVGVFAGLVTPLGAVGGAPWSATIPVVVVWWVSFALGTLEVHAIKARAKKKGRRSGWTLWASPLATAAVLAGITMAWAVSWPYRGYALATVPPALGVVCFEFLRVHPKHLKRVGWTLVGANTLTLILLLASE
jgi:hypothetical protein